MYKGKGDLLWPKSSIEDKELIEYIIKDKSKIVSRCPGIHGLVHKDSFSSILKMGLIISPEYFHFVPK